MWNIVAPHKTKEAVTVIQTKGDTIMGLDEIKVNVNVVRDQNDDVEYYTEDLVEEFIDVFRLRKTHDGCVIKQAQTQLANTREELKEVAKALKVFERYTYEDYADEHDYNKAKADLLKELMDAEYALNAIIVILNFHNHTSEAFRMVHESNMTKLGEDGKPIYNEAGKVIKGPNYRPPNILSMFEEV